MGSGQAITGDPSGAKITGVSKPVTRPGGDGTCYEFVRVAAKPVRSVPESSTIRLS